MSQDKENQQFARKFVDLWQERMTAMMHDGEFVRMLLKMVQGMPFSATTGSSHTSESRSYEPSASPSQAGGSSPAPDTGNAAVARIAEHLAAIERRIAGLEAGNATAKPKRVRRTVAKPAKRTKAKKRSRSRSKAKAR